ncbi:MAG: hypothetical protein ACOZCL_01945 [Bacillota bacterium]
MFMKKNNEEQVGFNSKLNMNQFPQSWVIPELIPFNDIFYRNCYANSLFPIMKYYGKDILSILVNDVLLYEFENGDIKIEKFSVNYFPVKSINDVITEEGLSTSTIYRSDSIIKEIIASISINRPVILWVDCFYESNRLDAFMKNHWPHTLLIHGFDNDNKVFDVIEHKFRDTLSYSKMKISYDDIERSYKGFLDNFQSHFDTPTFHSYYSEDSSLENICEFHDPQLKYRNIYLLNYRENIACVFEGLEKLKEFVSLFELAASDKEFILDKSECILAILNNIVNAWNVQKHRVEELFADNGVFLEHINEIIKDWSYVRAIIAKYYYSQVFVEHFFDGAIRVLKGINEKEKQFYNLLINTTQ